jgi:ribosomal protein S18 acetylase RimI-like enzyme
MSDTIFRLASETDRDILVSLTVEAFEGVSIDHGIERVLGSVENAQTWQERKARHVLDDLNAQEGAVLVAEAKSGRVIGYVSMRFDRAAKVGWIPNLAVASDARRAGLGRRLLELALGRFREEGLTIARIETLEHNAIGKHLYPSLGFVEVARQVHYARRLD